MAELLGAGGVVWLPVSVGVEPDLDPVGIVEAHEHGSTEVTLDDVVRLAQLVERRAPPLDVVAGRHEQGDGIETGPRSSACRVVPESDLRLAAVAPDRDALDLAVLHELDDRLEAEHALVPGSAAGDVAHGELDVVDTGEHGDLSFCSGTLELECNMWQQRSRKRFAERGRGRPGARSWSRRRTCS